MKFESKYKTFLSRKCIWKCRLRNGRHFVQETMSLGTFIYPSACSCTTLTDHYTVTQPKPLGCSLAHPCLGLCSKVVKDSTDPNLLVAALHALAVGGCAVRLWKSLLIQTSWLQPCTPLLLVLCSKVVKESTNPILLVAALCTPVVGAVQ